MGCVCSRTLSVSNGWPTSVTEMPPAPSGAAGREGGKRALVNGEGIRAATLLVVDCTPAARRQGGPAAGPALTAGAGEDILGELDPALVALRLGRAAHGRRVRGRRHSCCVALPLRPLFDTATNSRLGATPRALYAFVWRRRWMCGMEGWGVCDTVGTVGHRRPCHAQEGVGVGRESVGQQQW